MGAIIWPPEIASILAGYEQRIANLERTTGAPGFFSAYRAAASSLASGSIVPFDAEEADPFNWHNGAGRFQPNIPGTYLVTARVGAGVALTAGEFWVIQIAKNGAAFKNGMAVWQTANTMASSAAALVVLNGSTDFVEVILLHGHATPIALDVSSAATCYFQGACVRGSNG